MSIPRIALYAGSFNPFHVGHLDILRQAEKIFDEVYLGVGFNAAKSNPVNKVYNELNALGLGNRVVEIQGTITSTMKSLNIPTLIRGVRNAADLVEEANRGRYLRELLPNINIVYLFPSSAVEHVSSSALRELIGINTADSLIAANRHLVGKTNTAPRNNNEVSRATGGGSMFDSLRRRPE